MPDNISVHTLPSDIYTNMSKYTHIHTFTSYIHYKYDSTMQARPRTWVALLQVLVASLASLVASACLTVAVTVAAAMRLVALAVYMNM
jgi:hypothetical protein